MSEADVPGRCEHHGQRQVLTDDRRARVALLVHDRDARVERDLGKRGAVGANRVLVFGAAFDIAVHAARDTPSCDLLSLIDAVKARL
jgi:hypothetical protein